jgi:peroxiredoxin Q/BCP
MNARQRFLTLVAPGALAILLGLKAGDPAPDFALKNQAAQTVRLSDSKGHPVLIYFYPKDGTPGCTKEACALRDAFVQFQKFGAIIYGVSTQDSASHKDFIAKEKLPFDLLVDPKGEAAKQFGAGFIPNTDLLERKSVLVGPDGKVAKVYNEVRPAEHAAQVLKDLQALKTKS